VATVVVVDRRLVWALVATVVVVSLAWAGWPMSVSGGYACDGVGGALSWRTGTGSAARTVALRRDADMSRALASLAHDNAVKGTALGGEAKDDANDVRNRALRSLPQLSSCDGLARSRLALAGPAGLLAAGVFGLVVVASRSVDNVRNRPRRVAEGPPPACPLCGALLGVDGICSACNGVEAGATGVWNRELPERPPDVT
jgi:hypothetical protein